MKSFKQARRSIHEMTGVSRFKYMVTGTSVLRDAKALDDRTPEQRAKYVFSTQPPQLFLLVRARLAQYGIELIRHSRVDDTTKPLLTLRLVDAIAYCLYEYDQSVANEESKQRGVRLWNETVLTRRDKEGCVAQADLAHYAQRYVEVCMHSAAFPIHFSLEESDGYDDNEDDEDEKLAIGEHVDGAIPPSVY